MFYATIILFTLGIGFNGCISEKDNKSQLNEDLESSGHTGELLDEYLGVYHGIQESYFMKNQFGDDMIIAGNKVKVPSSDFKFLLKENNTANLQQTSIEDNQRYYYEGSYKVLRSEADIYKVEIVLSDGQGSSPTYILEINKTDKTGKCIGKNEPVLSVTKTN